MGKPKGFPGEVPAASAPKPKEEEEEEDTPVVQALKKIDARYCAILARYAAEEAALKKKFYDERQASIIAERCKALASDAKEEDKEFGTPACKGFWSKAMEKLDESGIDAIQEHDEPVLEYLDDIRSPDVDAKIPQKGSRVEFVFKENPFFTNSILWVEVTTDYDSTRPWKEPQVLEMKSSGVDWKPGKDVTVERLIPEDEPAKEVPRPSFFRSLFRNLRAEDPIPDDLKCGKIMFQASDGLGMVAQDVDRHIEMDVDPEDIDSDMMQEELLSQCLDKINEIKYNLIPYAVRYYTLEIGSDDDDDDEESEEESEDEDDSDSEDEAPKGKGGKSAQAKKLEAAKARAKKE